MKQILFILSLLIFSTNTNSLTAATNPVFGLSYTSSESSVNPPKKERAKKQKKRNKRRRNIHKNPKDSLVLPVLFWWVLMPLLIIGLFAVFFLTPFFFFWWIALGVFTIWAAISGIVFFPIQYIAFPGGMLLIVLSLILKSGLDATVFLLLLSTGVGLLLVAMFAFAFMALMFLMGTRKYQPKAK